MFLLALDKANIFSLLFCYQFTSSVMPFEIHEFYQRINISNLLFAAATENVTAIIITEFEFLIYLLYNSSILKY